MLSKIKKIIPVRLKRSIRAFFYPDTISVLDSRITYNQDGLVSIMNTDFLDEHDFVKSYSRGANTGSWGVEPQNKWRIYVACWAGRECSNLEGDFVECGVFRGGLARAVIEYTNFNSLNKKFFLFDTYEGLVEKQVTTIEKQNKLDTQYAHYKNQNVYDDVVNEFSTDNVIVVQGIIPESLGDVVIDKVAFLSIDMNCMEPEIEAISYFWPKLVPGAIVILDDYEWPQHEEQRNAFKQFAKEKNTQILPMPTGQGIIIK